MALSFPYELDFLAKCLTAERVPLFLKRFDEVSGSGDGRMWASQLSTPLWTSSYNLYSKSPAEAREINAKINALDGMNQTMLWSDPYYAGPASGTRVGLGSISIASIRADRGAIGLSGLPEGFVLSAGDYLSIPYAGGRIYFGQFAEGGTAGSTGGLGAREMRPYLPLSIAVGSGVNIITPRFKAMVTDFTPFSSFRGQWGDSASITIMQKP